MLPSFVAFVVIPWLDDARQTTAHQIRAAEIKALKQISFPDMDSDGLPSSYTIKVVTCLGKWQMKMTDLSLLAATWSYQPNNETVSRLHAISSCMARIYALRMSNVDRLAFLVPIEIVELVKKKSYIAWSIDRLWFPLRLATKATTLIQDLGKLSDEICEVNSAGLAEGHTPEQLSLLHMNWNSQCVALKKWYISYINHDWCAHGAICSKILSI